MSLKKKNNKMATPAFYDSEGAPSRRTPGLVWFYGLWVGLATLSDWVGHTTTSTAAALFLLTGVIATNIFFMVLSRHERNRPQLTRLLALHQTLLGIGWTTAYYYFSAGSGDLVLGMYMTALMYAVFHVTTRTLLVLCVVAIASHALILVTQAFSLPMSYAPLDDGVRFLVLVAISAWIYMYARQLRDLRMELECRNEELQHVVERITRIAEEDHLTKAYNRRHMMETLTREKSRADRSGNTFAVMLFDLDHFKTVNDRYGHLVGDQILTDFAARVKAELRGMDSVNTTEHKQSFGRYGGEEFLAILPITDADGAEYCADRIRSIIARHEFRDRYNITVSVGVAEYKLGETVPQLLTRADDALYEAKRDGRNRVRCSRPLEMRDTGTQPRLRILT